MRRKLLDAEDKKRYAKALGQLMEEMANCCGGPASRYRNAASRILAAHIQKRN